MSFSGRSTLWNSVEKIEKNRDAQFAREIALPSEIDRQSQIRFVRKYVQDIFVSAGMCADYSIHDKGDGNPHAHKQSFRAVMMDYPRYLFKRAKSENHDTL